MKTEIIYNGVRIKDILTDGIDASPVKESTGVDQIGTRLIVEGTGVIHIATQDLRGVRYGDLADGLNDTISKLTKDRRPFTLKVGDSVVVNIQPGAAEPNAPAGTVTGFLNNMDIDHGPKPSVHVKAVLSGYSATISFRFEMVIPNCGDKAERLDPTGLINFRFWIAENIDYRTLLTTRTYSGRLRVAHKHISAHSFARMVILPTVPYGFRRRVVSLNESSDGLHLDFSVVDEEVYAVAPWFTFQGGGSIDWRGSFAVMTNNGVTSESEFNVELTGPKNVPKSQLIEIAFKVFLAKTHYLELYENDVHALFRRFSVSESLHENKIEVSSHILHSGAGSYLLGIDGFGEFMELGMPLGDLGIGYDPGYSNPALPTASLSGMFLSMLQTVCNPNKMPIVGTFVVLKGEPPETPLDDQQQPSQIVQKDEKARKKSMSQEKAMYIEYNQTSEYHQDSGIMALPVGTSSDNPKATFTNITLHQPTCIREIRTDATRTRYPPETAIIKSYFDANGILCTPLGPAKVEHITPQIAADKRTPIHRTLSSVLYGLERPPRSDETLSFGSLPYLADNPAVNGAHNQDLKEPKTLHD